MLQKNSNSKRVFIEKIVQLYTNIINDEEVGILSQTFWDEFFILKANPKQLEVQLKALEDVEKLKKISNLLFEQCSISLQDSNQIRNFNALITLFILTKHILQTFKNFKQEELFSILSGSRASFKSFINSVCHLLYSDINLSLKHITIRLLLTMATVYCDLNNNIFAENLMSVDVFDALIDLLNNPYHQQREGHLILLLLVILLNYKKSGANPYVMKLSIVDNEAILNGYSAVISGQLIAFNKHYEALSTESKKGVFSTISTMVGSIFSGEELTTNCLFDKPETFMKVNTVLLAFYEVVLLNRNFISLLTTSSTDLLPSSLSSSAENLLRTDDPSESIVSPNLLVAFIEFTSAIVLDVKDSNVRQVARMCFVILTCITEDPCANSIIHDNNMSFVVNLRRVQMRHRRQNITQSSHGARPISHSIFDLITEFILAHTNRQMPFELMHFALEILLRLLACQKRCRIRIEYPWKELWTALILMLKFFNTNETHFVKESKKHDFLGLCYAAINLLNFFIMFGDCFLASTHDYDCLYYEIIRTHTVFDNLNRMALNYIKTKGSNDTKMTSRESAQKLLNCMINIKAIIAHFNAKIDEYSSQNQIVTLAEEQVLEVVKLNFDSLTLRIQDQLDTFEPYDPTRPEEFVFLMKLLADMIQDYAHDQHPIIDSQEQQNILADIQRQSQLSDGPPNSPNCSIQSLESPTTPTSVKTDLTCSDSSLGSSFVSIPLVSPPIQRDSASGDNVAHNNDGIVFSSGLENAHQQLCEP